MHSELSEALEEYRAGRPMVWYKCNGTPCKGTKCDTCEIADKTEKKPEGIAVELADCIINILDYLGTQNVDIDKVANETINYGMKDIEFWALNTFGDYISRWHYILGRASNYFAYNINQANRMLIKCLVEILDWFKSKNAYYLSEIIKEKMAYNRTRPYRHGGKVL